MNSLKTKIDADTTSAQTLADDKSIITDRIFAAVLPHDSRLLEFDIMQNVDAKMHGLIPQLQSEVNSAPSSIKAQVAGLFSDYQNQLAASEAQFATVNTDLPQITPANYNRNRASFETTLNNLHGDESPAEKDLHSAAKDLHQMVHLFRSHSASPKPTATP